MELIAILNRCHHFRGFVYHRARSSADKKRIEVSVRPRKKTPGYDQLAERHFEFIPLGGLSSFYNPCGAWIVAAVASWLSKNSPGATANVR